MTSRLLAVCAVAALLVSPCARGSEEPGPRPRPDCTGSSESADARKATETPAAATPASAGGLLVAIDPATGKIRPPEADEIRVLLEAAKPAGPAAPPKVRTLPDGTVAATLDPSFDSYSVVTRAPDGKLVMSCVEGKEKAEKAVGTGSRAPVKEALDEK